MRIRSFSPICYRVRLAGVPCGSLQWPLQSRHWLRTGFGSVLGAGALLAPIAFGPLSAQVQAAPTRGGDENGPQVQILQPSYQQVLKSNSRILIGIKAQRFNPQSIEIFFDDKPDSSGLIPLASAPSTSFTWDTKMFSDGPHKLTVRVTDVQGYRGWAEVNVFINNGKKIDSAPPTLGWLNVQPFQQLSGTADIQLQAADNFGVKWIIFSVNSASDPNRKPALRSWLLNRPPYNIKFDTSRVADGLYQFSAKAWDSFEQEGAAPPLTVGIVNRGGISATTIGEMLESMRQAQPAPAKPLPPLVAKEVKPNAPRTATLLPPTSASSALASKTQLQPSSPRLAERVTPKNSVKAAPNGSPSKAVGASKFEADVASELKAQNAVPADSSQPLASQPLIAAAPLPSALSNNAMLSASGSARELSQIGRRELSSDLFASSDFSSDRIAAPSGTARVLSGPALSQSGMSALSGERLSVSSAAPRVAADAPLSGRLSSPAALAERALPQRAVPQPSERTALAANPDSRVVAPRPLPMFSSPLMAAPPASGSARVANRVLPVPSEVENRGDLRVASPEVGGLRAVPLAPIATMSQANPMLAGAEPKIAPARVAEPTAAGRGMLAPFAVPAASGAVPAASGAVPAASGAVPAASGAVPAEPSASRAGVASSPDKPRLAALPRFPKSGRISEFSAITVSPLEVKTSDAIPAWHQVMRATDLRAVAARYGLPVDVVAACNNWPSDRKLSAGAKVKLPQQLKVAYQGVPVHSDAPSMLVGGTGVTAFRFLFEREGGKMTWDAKKQQVTARKGKSEVVLKIGSHKARVGDKDVMMELAAFLFEGRTMVPVRFFEEGLHAQVEWDPQTGRIVVAMAN